MNRNQLQNLDVSETARAWSSLSRAVFVPHTDEESRRIVAALDELVDEVGEDESHSLASLMEVLGALIENYETANVPEL